MKRQRTKKQHNNNKTVMPIFLSVPMLILAFISQHKHCFATASTATYGSQAGPISISSNFIPHNSASSAGSDHSAYTGTSNKKIYHSKNQPVAPSRPIDAPDIDYDGKHPFDIHRHLYDANYAAAANQQEKKKNDRSRSNRLMNGLRRQLKSDRKTDEDEKDKDKDEKETPGPTKYPTEPPNQNTFQFNSNNKDGGGNSQQQQDISDNDQGVDTSTLQITAATVVEDGSGIRTTEEEGEDSSIPPPAPTHILTALDPNTDHLYQPLRIQFNVQQIKQQMNLALSAGDSIAATKLAFLLYEILPMTADVWGEILRVIPVTGGIYPLAAQGSGVDQLLPNGQSNEMDATTGEEGGYYNDPVRNMYCPDETTSGIEGGADLLIYATVNRHCPSSGGGSTSTSANDNGRRRNLNEENAGTMGTLASALSCQRDQYDRPITGSIDFCLEGMRGVSTIDVNNYIANKKDQYPNDLGRMVDDDDLVGNVGASEKWDGWGGVTRSGSSSLGNNREMIQYSVGVAIHGKILLWSFYLLQRGAKSDHICQK